MKWSQVGYKREIRNGGARDSSFRSRFQTVTDVSRQPDGPRQQRGFLCYRCNRLSLAIAGKLTVSEDSAILSHLLSTTRELTATYVKARTGQRNPCAAPRNPCAALRNPCAAPRNPCSAPPEVSIPFP